MKLHFYVIKKFIFLILFLIASSFSMAAIGQDVYLSNLGDDGNSGLSIDKSVASLQRALDVAINLPLQKNNIVKILVDNGVYRGQIAVTKGVPKGVELQIRPLNKKNHRPKFDGDGLGGTWLTINNSSGIPSNIGIYDLEIVNFETAISINGNRNNFARSNGGNIIRNNIFSNIGQISSEAASPSTAAIRLVNSDGNKIFRNKFFNIINRERCVLLHAIYVAHNSTGNSIEENIFKNGCGDAIRFRDGSSNNVVKDNKFIDSWDKAPVSDWYCDSSNRQDCTKAEGECPSFNNTLNGNKILSQSGKSVPQKLTYGPDLSKNCNKVSSDERFIVK